MIMNELKKISDDGKKRTYQYTFELNGNIEIGKPTEDKYGGVNIYAEVIALIKEQFNWVLIRKAYNLDMDKPEDFHRFWTFVNPNYDTTLEEIKENWDNDPDLI